MPKHFVIQTAPMSSRVWILGAGGLVGSALCNTFGGRVHLGGPYTWGDLGTLEAQFDRDAASFAHLVAESSIDATEPTGWTIVWVAGRGVVGATAEDLAVETTTLSSLLKAIATHLPARNTAFFFASSAGATFAGSINPPFTEATEARSTSAYGDAKLEQEAVVRKAVISSGIGRAVIGRIANVYGAGQDLTKPQGLVTHLCLAAAERTSINLFVPLDTRRHYIDVRDVARQVGECCDRVRREPLGTCRLKLITSENSSTIGDVVRVVRCVARRPVRVATGLDTRASLQASDLRLRSYVWPEIPSFQQIELPIGAHSVMRDIDKQFAAGRLSLCCR